MGRGEKKEGPCRYSFLLLPRFQDEQTNIPSSAFHSFSLPYPVILYKKHRRQKKVSFKRKKIPVI